MSRLCAGIFIWLIFIPFRLSGQDLVLHGDWNLTIDESYLVFGKEPDLQSDYESDPDQVLMDVTGIAGRWQVSCYLVEWNWHRDFRLSVRRSSDGSGGGWVRQGGNYKQLTASARQLFRGLGERWSIGMQFLLERVSIDIPPDTYSVTLVYTVTAE